MNYEDLLKEINLCETLISTLTKDLKIVKPKEKGRIANEISKIREKRNQLNNELNQINTTEEEFENLKRKRDVDELEELIILNDIELPQKKFFKNSGEITSEEFDEIVLQKEKEDQKEVLKNIPNISQMEEDYSENIKSKKRIYDEIEQYERLEDDIENLMNEDEEDSDENFIKRLKLVINNENDIIKEQYKLKLYNYNPYISNHLYNTINIKNFTGNNTSIINLEFINYLKKNSNTVKSSNILIKQNDIIRFISFLRNLTI